MAAKATIRGLRRGPTTPGQLDTLARVALPALLAAAGAFLVYETRDTTFWGDEWTWILERRGTSVDVFLEPHNEHLSLVPLVLYKLLFATAGADDYTPYRLIMIAAHLALVALVFVYARGRVGGVTALLAAVLLLFFGPGWQNILWAFQVAWLISLAAGVGAFLMLDRGDRRGDVIAGVLVGVSLASSGVGAAIAAGVAVEVLWARRRLRDAWIVAAPLALYGLWWLAYADSDLIRHALVLTPGFVASSAAGVVSSLVGLSGLDPPVDGTSLEWGRPLAVAAVALLVWRLARLGPTPPRVAALLTILLSFWVLTGVRRSVISSPDASRYLYVGALFVVLLAVELLRGVSPSRRALLVAAVAVAAAALSNIGVMRDAGRFLRSQGEDTRAALGAVEIARDVVAPEHVVTSVPGYPFLVVRAGPYFDSTAALGSTAASPAELAGALEDARLVADGELFRIHEIELRPSAGEPAPGERPAVDSAEGGSVSSSPGCATFRPSPYTPAGAARMLAVTVPSSGVSVTTREADATIKLRRFAQTFPADAQGSVAPSSAATLRIRSDRADQPWHLGVESQSRVTVCGLR